MGTNIRKCLTTDMMWQTAIESNKITIDKIDAYWNGSSWATTNNWELSFRLGPITWTGRPSNVSSLSSKSLILVVNYNSTTAAVTTQLIGINNSDTGNYINSLVSTYYNSTTERRFLVATAQGAVARSNLNRETIKVTSIGSVSNGVITDFKFTWKGLNYYFSQVNYTAGNNLVYIKFDDRSETLIVNSKSMPTLTNSDISAYFTECSRLFEDGWYILNSHSGEYYISMPKNTTLIFQNYKGESSLDINTENLSNGSTNYDDNSLGAIYLAQDNSVINQRQLGTMTTLNSSGGLVWFSPIDGTSTQTSILLSNGKRNIGTYDCKFSNSYLKSTLRFSIPENSRNTYVVNQEAKSTAVCSRLKLYTTSLGDFAVTISQKSDYPIFKLQY